VTAIPSRGVPAAANLIHRLRFQPGPITHESNLLMQEAADMLDAIDAQVAELLAEHQPEWASDAAKAKGKDPIGCNMCFPHDGSWPCVSRIIAEEMHHALHPEGSTGSTGS
jgi:hypothetical protein